MHRHTLAVNHSVACVVVEIAGLYLLSVTYSDQPEEVT